MKELTKEDKARRYDEVINRMKHYVVDEYGCSRIKVADVFPELSVSEDEKIKKEIIALIEWSKSYNASGITTDEANEMLVWVEKQCEQKPTDKIQIGKEYKCIASPRYSTFMSGKIYKPEDKFLCSFMNFCSDCFEPIEDSEQIDLASNTDKLEPKFKHGDRVRNKKTGLEQTLGSCIEDVYEGAFPFRIKDQDEWELVKQTPADEVEPKFKVGDWIVQENIGVFQVIEVCESWYEVVDNKDKDYSIGFDKEYMLRHWTIQDAKDGDVLISSVNKPFIYDGHFDENIVGAYCGLYINGDFVIADKESYWTQNINIRPSTKEQRDFLFLNMKEAGYKWDSEQKQLITLNHFVDNNDMVEPRFKVGDWVIREDGKPFRNGNKFAQIKSIKFDGNMCFLDTGRWLYSSEIRAWSIYDAKPGDVLVDCNKDEVILMFRGIGNTEWDEVIDYHCYYSCFQKAFCVQKGVDYWGNTNDHRLKPATKEQRDTLMKAMTDAGYEFDFEKKELKKQGEQKPVEWSEDDFDYVMYI